MLGCIPWLHQHRLRTHSPRAGQPVLPRGSAPQGFGAKANGLSPRLMHLQDARIIWILFAKFPFPSPVLLQTAQRDPQIAPTAPERAASQPDPQLWGQRRPGPWRLHSGGGLFAGAPQTCPSTQAFYSNEKPPLRGGNK